MTISTDSWNTISSIGDELEFELIAHFKEWSGLFFRAWRRRNNENNRQKAIVENDSIKCWAEYAIKRRINKK